MFNPIGGFLQAGGSIMEAHDKADAYNKEAEDYERNASRTRSVGQYNAMRLNIAAGRKFGGISADYAASGVSSDSQSVLDVLQSSHVNAEFDRLNVLHGAEMRAQSMDERSLYDRSASNRATQMGYFNAVTSVFSMGANAGVKEPSPHSAGDTSVDEGGGDEGEMD